MVRVNAAPSRSAIMHGAALPRWSCSGSRRITEPASATQSDSQARRIRSEEHTSELQSLMRISYAVFCLKKKKSKNRKENNTTEYHTTHQKHKTGLTTYQKNN